MQKFAKIFRGLPDPQAANAMYELVEILPIALAVQAKHADAVDRMYKAAKLDLMTATEGEKASLRMRLMDGACKAGMSVSGLTDGAGGFWACRWAWAAWAWGTKIKS